MVRLSPPLRLSASPPLSASLRLSPSLSVSLCLSLSLRLSQTGKVATSAFLNELLTVTVLLYVPALVCSLCPNADDGSLCNRPKAYSIGENCQGCYHLDEYERIFGSADCTNRLAKGAPGPDAWRPSEAEIQTSKAQGVVDAGGQAKYNQAMANLKVQGSCSRSCLSFFLSLLYQRRSFLRQNNLQMSK